LPKSFEDAFQEPWNSSKTLPASDKNTGATTLARLQIPALPAQKKRRNF
jgi:hypothetical protein